jgi:spore coat protein U-like protein
MTRIFAKAVIILLAIIGFSSASFAQVPVTANLGVQITITGGCAIQNVNNVNFGTHSLLSANVDTTGSFEVVCTTGLPFSIALNGGGGGAINARRMIFGASTIGYQLYSDPARTLIWGETAGVDRVTGTGSGVAQLETVYARVPPQSTPVAGTYLDTVTISVYF